MTYRVILSNPRTLLRDRFTQFNSGFDADTVAQVLKLYAPKDKFAAIVQRDGRHYQKAASVLAISGTENPITAQANLYEAPLSLARVSAELDLSPDQLRAMISALPSAAGINVLGTLTSFGGGYVSRDAFEAGFAAASSAPTRALIRPNRSSDPLSPRSSPPSRTSTLTKYSPSWMPVVRRPPRKPRYSPVSNSTRKGKSR